MITGLQWHLESKVLSNSAYMLLRARTSWYDHVRAYRIAYTSVHIGEYHDIHVVIFLHSEVANYSNTHHSFIYTVLYCSSLSYYSSLLYVLIYLNVSNCTAIFLWINIIVIVDVLLRLLPFLSFLWSCGKFCCYHINRKIVLSKLRIFYVVNVNFNSSHAMSFKWVESSLMSFTKSQFVIIYQGMSILYLLYISDVNFGRNLNLNWCSHIFFRFVVSTPSSL